MEDYSDAVVGVSGEGLNVEQRKRLSIGVELVAKPKLLVFLDDHVGFGFTDCLVYLQIDPQISRSWTGYFVHNSSTFCDLVTRI